MDSQSRSTKVRHIPRRSGVGARQVIAPKVEKSKRRRVRPVVTLCNAEHPERTGVADIHGNPIDAVLCARELEVVKGKPVPHKGEHRARLLRGIVERWIEVA